MRRWHRKHKDARCEKGVMITKRKDTVVGHRIDRTQRNAIIAEIRNKTGVPYRAIQTIDILDSFLECEDYSRLTDDGEMIMCEIDDATGRIRLIARVFDVNSPDFDKTRTIDDDDDIADMLVHLMQQDRIAEAKSRTSTLIDS